MSAYITSVGSFLPGDPIGNDELENYLGTLPVGSDRLKKRMLDANGIEKRHYAIDRNGRTLMLNEELAERAVREALSLRGITPRDLAPKSIKTSCEPMLAIRPATRASDSGSTVMAVDAPSAERSTSSL